MASQITLTSLNPREAVGDAILRCVLGMDSNNRELFESAFMKDESMSVGFPPGTIGADSVTIQGWTAVNKFFDKVFDIVTTHDIFNNRIELTDGADTASMVANAIAYHVRPEDARKPEDTSFTASSLYFLDLVRDDKDGLWKIKKWDIKGLWTTGDRAIVAQ